MRHFRQNLAVVLLKPCQPLAIQFRSERGALARPDIAMTTLPGGIVRALPAGSVVAKDQCQPNAVPVPRRRQQEPVCRTGERASGRVSRHGELASRPTAAARPNDRSETGHR